jgi:hypothetical protein
MADQNEGTGILAIKEGRDMFGPETKLDLKDRKNPLKRLATNLVGKSKPRPGKSTRPYNASSKRAK